MSLHEYLRISGGTVYDPANGVDGEVRDLWIDGSKIVAAPADPAVRPTREIDARGLVVMPGGVDMHCHIAGPKVNVARKMRPEEKRKSQVMGDKGPPRFTRRSTEAVEVYLCTDESSYQTWWPIAIPRSSASL